MISPPLSSIPVSHPIIVGQLYMTSFNTSFGTTDSAFAVSRRFQGMPKVPTSCQRGRAQRSAHPGHSRKRCWFPRTGIAAQSWLTRCCQRTGRNSWCKRSHWSPLEIDKRSKNKKEGEEKIDVWRKEENPVYVNWKLALACHFWPEGTCQKSVINVVSCSNQLCRQNHTTWTKQIFLGTWIGDTPGSGSMSNLGSIHQNVTDKLQVKLKRFNANLFSTFCQVVEVNLPPVYDYDNIICSMCLHRPSLWSLSVSFITAIMHFLCGLTMTVRGEHQWLLIMTILSVIRSHPQIRNLSILYYRLQ